MVTAAATEPTAASQNPNHAVLRPVRRRAFRAVGQANHNNPIAIIVPCHRIVGTNGTLTGYGGGLGNKEMLLRLEGVETHSAGNQQMLQLS
jgi:alkylated DNA nucleotide flippase Atl1